MANYRTLPSGSVQAIVKLNSGEVLTKTYDTRDQAELFAKQVDAKIQLLQLEAMSKGEASPIITREDIFPEQHTATCSETLEGFTDTEYQAWREAEGTDRCCTRAAQVQWWIEYFGPQKRLDNITTPQINKALMKYAGGTVTRGKNIGKRRSKATVDRMRAALSSLLTCAVEMGVINTNVARDSKKYAKGSSMTTGKKLEQHERMALLSAAKDVAWQKMFLNLVIAMDSGGRQGEISQLRWQDIDFNRRELTFVHDPDQGMHTKSKKSRTIPLSKTAIVELMKYRRQEGMVFPGKRVSRKTGVLGPMRFRNHWEKVLEVSGVECRYHDLRHDAASRIVNGGVSIHKAKELLGHCSVTVTEKYLHSDHESDDEVRTLNDGIFASA